MDFEHEKRLTAVEERAKSNTHRLDKVEEQTEAINKLATSVAVMTERVSSTGDKVDVLVDDVQSLKDKPSKRWEGLVEKALWAVAAAVITFLLSRIGL